MGERLLVCPSQLTSVPKEAGCVGQQIEIWTPPSSTLIPFVPWEGSTEAILNPPCWGSLGEMVAMVLTQKGNHQDWGRDSWKRSLEQLPVQPPPSRLLEANVGGGLPTFPFGLPPKGFLAKTTSRCVVSHTWSQSEGCRLPACPFNLPPPQQQPKQPVSFLLFFWKERLSNDFPWRQTNW